MPTGSVRDGLRELIQIAERERESPTPDGLRRRIEVLERLESHLDDPQLRDDATLWQRAADARVALETANQQAYDTLRSAIQDGAGIGVAAEWLSHPALPPTAADHDGYDYLDEIVAGILQLDDPGPASIAPTSEMVFYQPTPARHLLDLFDRAALTGHDVLFDLGSGLGHVAIMTAICTRARAVGVELEPAYVACAQRAAAALNLESVSFIADDARNVSLDDGTLYFLYTPFSGRMLRTMLDLLRAQAERRQIRVAAYGPCTAVIAAEGWLTADAPPQAGRVAIFRSLLPAP
jgi:hypothetical protein